MIPSKKVGEMATSVERNIILSPGRNILSLMSPHKFDPHKKQSSTSLNEPIVLGSRNL